MNFQYNNLQKILLILILFFSFLGLAKTSQAAPSIDNVTGTVEHGQNITISGADFGTKSPAAPALWQNFEDKNFGTHPLASEGWIDNTSKQYWSVDDDMRSVTPPHTRSTKYIAGEHTHDIGDGSQSRTNIALVFSADETQNIWVVYAYLRFSPDAANVTSSYCTNQGATVGENYKEWWFHHQCNSDADYTTSYWSTDQFVTNDQHALFSNSGGNDPCGTQINEAGWGLNPTLGWGHKEVIMRMNPGFLSAVNYSSYGTGREAISRSCAGNLWPNPTVCPFHDPATRDSVCSVEFGSFTRYCLPGTNVLEIPVNWYRYLDDVYIDNTFSRIVLANDDTYENATIVEPQIPSSWTSNSAEIEVNLGNLSDTGTAYLFVFDADNNHNPTGYEVTLNGEPDTTPPAAPSGLNVS